MIFLAHGLGGRSDLPVPLWMALYGAAIALLISFFALGAFWLKPRLGSPAAGRPIPSGLQAFLDSGMARAAARTVGGIALLAALGVAFLGDEASTFNPAPTWFYVWFWVGLVPLSLLLGPVWKVMNPLRAFSGAIRKFLGPDDSVAPSSSLPDYRPAAVSLAAFVWLELVYDRADRPLVVAAFIAVYALVHIGAGVQYGPGWFARGDGFEVYSSLLARLAPIGRRQDGRLVWRSPLNGLAATDREAALVPVVAVILGSTAFDGLTRTELWDSISSDKARAAYLLIGTIGLAAAIGFVWLTYVWASTFGQRFLATNKRPSLEGQFIHSLIPIAAGYTIAHYFSLLIFQGQAGFILASDPFQNGSNLFGTADWDINYTLVSTSVIAIVQILSIVLGHVIGVVVAHDRSVELYPEEYKRRAQYSLLAVMVLYTVGGIALLVGT